MNHNKDLSSHHRSSRQLGALAAISGAAILAERAEELRRTQEELSRKVKEAQDEVKRRNAEARRDGKFHH